MNDTPVWPSLIDAIAHHAAVRPDMPAFIHVEPGELDQDETLAEYSYADLALAVRQWAAVLTVAGARKDGAVALLLRNTPAHYALMVATSCVSAGLSLNPLQTVDHMVELLIAAGADIVVMPRQEDDEALYKLGHVLIEKCAARRKMTPLVVRRAISPDVDGNVSLPTLATINGNDPAAWFHTGGTTGAPKLIRHRHIQHAIAASAFTDAADLKDTDRLANGLPLFHVAGAICSTRAPWWGGGCVVNLSENGFRNPAIVKGFWSIIDRTGVTIVGGVPTAIATVLDQTESVDNPRLRFGLAGGAPCTPALQMRFAKVTGRSLHIVYGMTETCGVIAVGRADNPSPVGVIGPAGKGISLGIRDMTGAVLPDGESGGIWVCGGNVSPPEPDMIVDGWMPTGDQGRMTPRGLAITGRISDMIIRSGHNIDPAMIEAAAISTGQVTDAAAIGQPDAYAGEVPVIFLVRSSASKQDAAAVAEQIIGSIPDRAAHPRSIFWRESLPVTAVGKIDRKQLRAEVIEHLVRDEARRQMGSIDFDLTVTNPQALRPIIAITWKADKPRAERIDSLRAWADEFNLELE